jgi:hypothetical protein
MRISPFGRIAEPVGLGADAARQKALTLAPNEHASHRTFWEKGVAAPAMVPSAKTAKALYAPDAAVCATAAAARSRLLWCWHRC